MNAVARRIQTILTQQKKQLKPVTRDAGVEYGAVYPWWQRENAKPNFENVRKLATALQVSTEWIWTGEGTPELSLAEHLAQKIESLEEEDQKDAVRYVDFLFAKRAQATDND